MAATQEFYKYQDASGRTVLVDSLSRVPVSERAGAERIVITARADSGQAAQTESARPPSSTDWPSFGLGFGAALVVAAVVFSRRAAGPMSRVLAFGVGATILAAGYFGWLRRLAGQSDAPFTSPSVMIEDARRAVEQMKQRNQDQEQTIDRALDEASGKKPAGNGERPTSNSKTGREP